VKIHPTVNLGLATATERGLVVPVIELADRKGLPEIATARANLTARAREGRLGADEVGHSSFTLTNLGAYGIDQFQPIINAPESSILAVGRIKERPTGVNGELILRPTVFLTLACDHRVLDGARAASFLQRVTELIEDPYALLAAGGLLEGGGDG
jgi:pyruvate dehydrogenase E2 component (dihydrolipoamide acetyltransferase)